MQTISEELANKTLIYWKLSQVRQGKRDVIITTGEAIEICQGLLATTNYQRPINRYSDLLLQDIINGEGVKYPEAKIIPLKKQGATE